MLAFGGRFRGFCGSIRIWRQSPHTPCNRALAASLIVIIFGVTTARAGDPPGDYQGELDSALYRISVPPNWNGGLIAFAHGYQGQGSGPGLPFPEPLDAYLSKRGYAWLSSGYRSKGYHPDEFLLDLIALRALFIEKFGQPRWTIIHGQSMGGHVTIASMELHPEVYQGALIECGIIDGVGLVDWLHAYTAAAEYFSGLPLLETPQPEFYQLANVRFPVVMGTPGHYTDRGLRFDSVVKHLMGGEVPLRLEGMTDRYIANLAPTHDPGPNRAEEFSRYADTRRVHYEIDPGLGVDEATLNRDIPRVLPDPDAPPNPVFAELTGNIQRPVLTLHETADFRVPFRLQQNYRRRTIKAGTADLLVQRAVRATGHCGFGNPEREAAFADLVAWIEAGNCGRR